MTEEENGYSVAGWTKWQDLDDSQKQWELHRVMVMLDHRTRSVEKNVQNLQHNISFEAFKPLIRKWAVLTSATVTVLFLGTLVGLKITVGI